VGAIDRHAPLDMDDPDAGFISMWLDVPPWIQSRDREEVILHEGVL
jgi:hypothetical protein